MPAPEDPQELELVRKAFALSHIGGCVVWHEKEARQLQAKPPISDLFPDHVRNLLIQFVTNGGVIVQKKEDRDKEKQSKRAYWYKAKVPYEGLPKGLFIEFWLEDDDPDFPTVELLNYHK